MSVVCGMRGNGVVCVCVWLGAVWAERGFTADSSCCANCVEPFRPQQWVPDLPFLMRTRWMAGAAAHKRGWCRDQYRSATLNKQVWICDVCHKQIHVRKQLSIRCNRIEHCVHLRCAGIRQAQYTDTWTLIPAIYTKNPDSHLTQHNTSPPHPILVQAPYPLPTYTTATKTQTHVQHSPCPHMIGKAQTQFSHPLTPLSTHTARAKHMSHTPTTPLTTLISSTSPVLYKTPEPRVPHIHALTATTPPPNPTPALPSPSHTLTAHTHATQTTVHASQSPQKTHSQHRVLRQPHIQTNDYHRTTNTTQTHRPIIKSERNLIILQVNVNGLRNKLEELKLLIHDTHADITILETKLTPKAKTPTIHNFTAVRADRLHKAWCGLITLIRYNITFTTTDIPSTINTQHRTSNGQGTH